MRRETQLYAPGVTFRHGSAELRMIPGASFAGLAASRKGDIWSIRSGRWNKLKPQQDGGRCKRYLRVNFIDRVDLRRRNFCVHVLVAEAWLPPRPHWAAQIDHRNRDQLDNSADNLRWLSQEANLARRYGAGEDEDESWEGVL